MIEVSFLRRAVYDKDSLFDLSYAFMRRFNFIEIEVPKEKSQATQTTQGNKTPKKPKDKKSKHKK